MTVTHNDSLILNGTGANPLRRHYNYTVRKPLGWMYRCIISTFVAHKAFTPNYIKMNGSAGTCTITNDVDYGMSTSYMNNYSLSFEMQKLSPPETEICNFLENDLGVFGILCSGASGPTAHAPLTPRAGDVHTRSFCGDL